MVLFNKIAQGIISPEPEDGFRGLSDKMHQC